MTLITAVSSGGILAILRIEGSQAAKTSGKVWCNEDLPFTNEHQVREYLKKLDPSNASTRTEEWPMYL